MSHAPVGMAPNGKVGCGIAAPRSDVLIGGTPIAVGGTVPVKRDKLGTAYTSIVS